MALNVKVGTYTGNGATSGTRAITGIGFQPKFMLVWTADTGEIYPVWCVDTAITGLGACGSFFGENGWFTVATADRFNSFDADGFTIACGSQTGASLKALNKNAITYYYLALGGTDVHTSSYTGNGSDNRNITGVGFQPEFVLTHGGSQHHCFKLAASGISTDTSSQFWFTSDASNMIQALQSDGFQVGTANQANINGVVYYYVAVKASADFVSGQYTGNGSDPRDITAVGFQPDFILIKGTGAQECAFRSSDNAGDVTKYYRSSGMVANLVQSFLSNGFQLGSSSIVNSNTVVYTYLAIKTPSGGGGGGATYIPKIIMS